MLHIQKHARRAGLIVTTLILASFAFAAEPPASSRVTPSPAVAPDVVQPNPAKEEIAILKAQLEQMRLYDARLLATVYWALGVLAALTVGIIGFGWFANFKVYERDKAQLTDVLHAAAKTSAQAGEARAKESAQSIEARLSKALDAKVKDLSESLKSDVSDLRRHVLSVQLEQILAEAKDWRSRGVLANSIATLRQALGIAVQLPWGWDLQVPDILDAIVADLTSLKQSNDQLDADAASQLTTMLSRLPESYEVTKSRIRALI
jgi:hypothetical protein